MKKILILLSILCFIPALHAQTQPEQAAQALKEALSELQTFQARFQQRVVDLNGEVLQESFGTIALKQPNRMLWEVTEPDETTLIADGQTVWHLDPFVEQVVAMDQQGTVSDNPIILLADPASEQWQNFIVTQTEQGFAIDSRSEEAQIQTLVLVFDGIQLTSLSFVDRQTQRTELIFSDIAQNQAIPEASFIFTLPDNFALDDQRSQ